MQSSTEESHFPVQTIQKYRLNVRKTVPFKRISLKDSPKNALYFPTFVYP